MIKKILFVIPRMRFGGAEKVVARLANILAEEGKDVTVYSLQKVDNFYYLSNKVNYLTGQCIITNSNSVLRTFERLINLPKSFVELQKLIIREKYDLILSFNYSADILVGLCHFCYPKFEYICSERNDPFQIPKVKCFILKQIYKRAAAFVCQSEAVSCFYGNCLNNKVIIPNFIDLSSVPKTVSCNKNRIVSVGRLDEQKNYDLLIEAFAECVKEGLNVKLEIYGDGLRKEALSKRINEMNMDDYIILKGVTENALESINGAYLFIISSIYEGFPNVFLEAMSVGVPIVTTDFSPGTAKDIINENIGIVVENNSKDELKKAIKRLIVDEKLREAMSKNCIDAVRQYDINKIYPLWKRIIDSGLEK